MIQLQKSFVKPIYEGRHVYSEMAQLHCNVQFILYPVFIWIGSHNILYRYFGMLQCHFYSDFGKNLAYLNSNFLLEQCVIILYRNFDNMCHILYIEYIVHVVMSHFLHIVEWCVVLFYIEYQAQYVTFWMVLMCIYCCIQIDQCNILRYILYISHC